MKELYRRVFSAGGVLRMAGSFVISALEAVYPLLYAEWLRRVISAIQSDAVWNGRLLAMGPVLLLLQLGLAGGCGLYRASYGKWFLVRLREAFFDKLNRIVPESLNACAAGEVITLQRADLAALSKFYTADLQRLAQIVISFVSAVGYFTSINPVFIPACVLPALGGFFLMGRARRRQLDVRRAEAAVSDELTSLYEDISLGYGDLKQNAAEENFLKKGEACFEKNTKIAQDVRKYDQLVFFLSVLSHSLSSVLILASGILFAHQGLVDVGAVVAAYNIFYMIANPIRNFSRNLACFQKRRVAAERLEKLFSLPDEHTDGESEAPTSDCPLSVSLESYTYPSGFTLPPVGFAVPRGAHLAVVGRSGCGKSTLARLLLGYSENYHGQILWFGRELKAWSLQTLRARVRYVANDFWIPEMTVREYLCGDADEDGRMEEALRAVELWDELQQQAERTETCLKNNAGNLSGGQRQRLLLARAILDGGDVFVLDEMLSAMDLNQAQRILKNLRAYCPTVIQITHIPAFAQTADQVLMLSAEQPAILSDHDSLMRACEAYRELIAHAAEKEETIC